MSTWVSRLAWDAPCSVQARGKGPYQGGRLLHSMAQCEQGLKGGRWAAANARSAQPREWAASRRLAAAPRQLAVPALAVFQGHATSTQGGSLAMVQGGRYAAHGQGWPNPAPPVPGLPARRRGRRRVGGAPEPGLGPCSCRGRGCWASRAGDAEGERAAAAQDQLQAAVGTLCCAAPCSPALRPPASCCAALHSNSDWHKTGPGLWPRWAAGCLLTGPLPSP